MSGRFQEPEVPIFQIRFSPVFSLDETLSPALYDIASVIRYIMGINSGIGLIVKGST